MLRIIAVCLFAFGAMSCSRSQDDGRLESPFHRPLRIDALPDFRSGKASPVLVVFVREDGSTSAPLAAFSETLTDSLQRNTNLVILNATEPKRVAQVLQQAEPSIEGAIQAARSLQAKGLLFGRLLTFVEAEGSALGGERQAAVKFELRLVDASSGRTQWNAVYASEDKPLTDNLFRLPEVMNRGLTYRSAQELARRGMDLAAADLERRR